MEEIQLVCASVQMRQVANTVRMSRGRPLLLTGETGVGKDVMARWAHSISPYAEGPFVDINCAAIQDALWESEIFGHAKGAFTGAVQDKKGQVEAAEGGTLFLNEIGDMPLATQAKLLTFLDTHEYQRVGETQKRSVSARVIAATNRDLDVEIATGIFRRDLYYRLAQVHVKIPPLRERPADVLALASWILQKLTRAKEAEPVGLSETARELLLNARWQGNARQLHAVLEMALERLLEAKGTTLTPEHFSPELPEPYTVERPQHDPRSTPHDGVEPNSELQSDFGSINGEPNGLQPTFPFSADAVLSGPAELRAFLDHFRGPAGRWNITAAHRALVQQGTVKIGRRAFSDRIKRLFPEEGSAINDA